MSVKRVAVILYDGEPMGERLKHEIANVMAGYPGSCINEMQISDMSLEEATGALVTQVSKPLSDPDIVDAIKKADAFLNAKYDLKNANQDKVIIQMVKDSDPCDKSEEAEMLRQSIILVTDAKVSDKLYLVHMPQKTYSFLKQLRKTFV